MISKFLVLIICLTPLISEAARRRVSSSMGNTVYFQAMVGSSALGESKDAPMEAKDQEMTTSTGLTAALGYRWHRFAIELMYVNFGTPTIDVDKLYTEEHKASFIGGGPHWAWWFFDLKFGIGTVKDTTTFTKGKEATTFTASPNKETNSYPGGYFGFGFNFDLGTNTELVIDYTTFAWNIDKEQTIEIDNSEHISSDTTPVVGVLSLGFRWFF